MCMFSLHKNERKGRLPQKKTKKNRACFGFCNWQNSRGLDNCLVPHRWMNRTGFTFYHEAFMITPCMTWKRFPYDRPFWGESAGDRLTSNAENVSMSCQWWALMCSYWWLDLAVEKTAALSWIWDVTVLVGMRSFYTELWCVELWMEGSVSNHRAFGTPTRKSWIVISVA